MWKTRGLTRISSEERRKTDQEEGSKIGPGTERRKGGGKAKNRRRWINNIEPGQIDWLIKILGENWKEEAVRYRVRKEEEEGKPGQVE